MVLKAEKKSIYEYAFIKTYGQRSISISLICLANDFFNPDPIKLYLETVYNYKGFFYLPKSNLSLKV